jgi:putative lipoic acid-binding regulatory protein
MKDEGVLGFPCFYTFKVFGQCSDTFCADVRAVIAANAGAIPLDSVKVRHSERGNYLCVSVIARLHSRQQLDRIYADLHAHREVLLCL